MKTAINAWSVANGTVFESLFPHLSAAGFDGVELNLDRDNASGHSLTFSTSGEELRRIRALSEQYNLPVVSVSTSLYGASMGSDVPEEREFAARVLRRQLELAAALGARGILAVPGGISESVSLKAARENCLNTLEALRGDMDASGLFVGLENVWNGFFMSPFDVCGFLDELGCASVGAYFDIGNVCAFSNPAHWIEVLGERIGMTHIKGYRRNGGLDAGGVWTSIADAGIDWPRVKAALDTAGFDGYLTAEVGKDDPEQPYTDFYREVHEQIDTILNAEGKQ